MVQISLKILINKEELEQDNINEKNIKIVINDSDKILDNTNLIKINNKNLIIKTEELKKELKNINKNVEKNDKKVKLIGSPKVNKENVINKNVITKNKTLVENKENNNDNINKNFKHFKTFKNKINLKIKIGESQQQKKVFNFDPTFLSLNYQHKKTESRINVNFIEKFKNDNIDENSSNIFKYIFFGESKCGKTMLINNFIHYIKNIPFSSEKRIKIDLEELNDLKKYKIKSNKVNFPSAILIDTPPLEKMKDNKNLIDKINNYKNLNGIIFVLKNSDIKLHDNAKYFINIFKNIIKNLGNKIYIMGTFYDAQKNLEYLRKEEIFKKIKLVDILYFNNNCLFKIDKISEENWRRNYSNFNNFFNSNEFKEEVNLVKKKQHKYILDDIEKEINGSEESEEEEES